MQILKAPRSRSPVPQKVPVDDGKVNSVVMTGRHFRQEWVWQLKFPKTGALVQQMSRNRKKLVTACKSK